MITIYIPNHCKTLDIYVIGKKAFVTPNNARNGGYQQIMDTKIIQISLAPLQKDNNKAKPTIRIRRLAHELLQWRRERHRRAVEDHVRQHGVPAAREQAGQEGPQGRAEGLLGPFIFVTNRRIRWGGGRWGGGGKGVVMRG